MTEPRGASDGEGAPRLHWMGLPLWTWLAPVVAGLVLALAKMHVLPVPEAFLGIALVWSVSASVHQAEVVAHRVGEPFGTLVLAVAVTIIEAALILSLMAVGGPAAAGIARDTVFAAIMIILTGLIGMCMVIGGIKHYEQSFTLDGAKVALSVIAALAVISLVLPNFTISSVGPTFTSGQLAMVGVVSLVLYAVFVVVQTIRHRDYFLPQDPNDHEESHHAPKPTLRTTWTSFGLLLVSLTAVILLAKSLSPTLKSVVVSVGAPIAVVGVLVALIVLLPEAVAAIRAAMRNRLQTSVNLALGSAVAAIGLTIPTVVTYSLVTGSPLAMGLDGRSMVLLALSLFAAKISFDTGKTTVMQGAVHLTIFAVYLYTTFSP